MSGGRSNEEPALPVEQVKRNSEVKPNKSELERRINCSANDLARDWCRLEAASGELLAWLGARCKLEPHTLLANIS